MLTPRSVFDMQHGVKLDSIRTQDMSFYPWDEASYSRTNIKNHIIIHGDMLDVQTESADGGFCTCTHYTNEVLPHLQEVWNFGHPGLDTSQVQEQGRQNILKNSCKRTCLLMKRQGQVESTDPKGKKHWSFWQRSHGCVLEHGIPKARSTGASGILFLKAFIGIPFLG